MTAASPATRACGWFLPGKAGPLYAFYQPPLGGPSGPQRAVLVAPPFAEEMNKVRRMLVLQARQLAACGLGTVIVDLYGTGDSSGDFGEARWETWRADLEAVCAWLVGEGIEHIVLLGVRLGALLALDFLQTTKQPIERVVLWQPVISGEGMLLQFLRMRVAASMLADAKEKQTTEELRRTLSAGRAIEVGGYELAPALAAAIGRLKLEDLVRPGLAAIDWLEIVPESGRSLPPASRRVLEGCRARGVAVRAGTIVGAPFWASVEIATAPPLLDATSRCLLPPGPA